MAMKITPFVMVLTLGTMAVASREAVGQGIAGLDTAAIEQASGLKGQVIADENVFKIGKPRADVKIEVDQWNMAPFMGLGSWAAFTPRAVSSGAAVMELAAAIVPGKALSGVGWAARISATLS